MRGTTEQSPVLSYASPGSTRDVTIANAAGGAEAEMISGQLAAAGIRSQIINRNVEVLGPYAPGSSVKVIVMADDAGRAREVLRDEVEPGEEPRRPWTTPVSRLNWRWRRRSMSRACFARLPPRWRRRGSSRSCPRSSRAARPHPAYPVKAGASCCGCGPMSWTGPWPCWTSRMRTKTASPSHAVRSATPGAFTEHQRDGGDRPLLRLRQRPPQRIRMPQVPLSRAGIGVSCGAKFVTVTA